MRKELPQEDKELIAKIDERLKHYKLITDNEQQAPVEWEVGEWAWNSYTKDFLGTIKSIDKSAYYAIELDNQNGKTEEFCNLDMLVKPTKEEIEQHLVKIAENKGFRIGTQYRWPNKPSISEEIRTVDGKLEYNAEVNAFGHNNYTIWDSKSGWAEPITEQKERFKVDVCKHSTQNNYRIEVKLNGVDVRLPKEEAERAAQAIRETLKNL